MSLESIAAESDFLSLSGEPLNATTGDRGTELSDQVPSMSAIIPETFQTGDFVAWLRQFECCANANNWDLHVYRIRFRFRLEIIAQYLERMSNFPKQHREQKSLSYYNNKQQKYSLIHYYIALWHEQSFLKNGVYVQFSLGRMSSTHAILSTPVLRSEKFS